MKRTVFRVILSLVVAVVGVFAAALVLPRGLFVSIFTFIPIVVIALTWYLTRKDKSATVVDAPRTSPAIEKVPTAVPQISVAQRKTRMWMSVAGLVVLIGAMFGWSYLSQVQRDDRLLVEMLESRAQEVLGPQYVVDKISFPNGSNAYDYPVAVWVHLASDGTKELFTLLVRGDCDQGCRIGLDPRDALRLMATNGT